MFSEQDVINLLKTLPYTVALTKGKEIELTEEYAAPKIYVGYGTIVSKNTNDIIDRSYYATHGEDLSQFFDIQIVCNRSDLPTVWRSVYVLLIGQNPIPLEKDRSGFTLSQSGPMGFSNSSVWWLSRWLIGFPTTFVMV